MILEGKEKQHTPGKYISTNVILKIVLFVVISQLVQLNAKTLVSLDCLFRFLTVEITV